MAKYRKKEGSDVWHYCKNCTSYPKQDYKERESRPNAKDICSQCRSKSKNGNCK